jgi:uncharacterized protein YbjQ (UPF0145 family)
VLGAVHFSTTDSLAGYRILRSQGIIYAQAPNRYQGLGTSGMDNKQARKTTNLLLETLLPMEVSRSGGNTVIGVKIDGICAVDVMPNGTVSSSERWEG